MLCTHKTTILCQFGLFFVTTLPTHISTNSQPFLVGIVSVTFLESAVESDPDLQHVKITDNVLQAQLDSTRPISYRSYFDLLKDAAFHLDQATKRGNQI